MGALDRPRIFHEPPWSAECACGHPYGVHDEKDACHATNPGNWKPDEQTTYHECFCHHFQYPEPT